MPEPSEPSRDDLTDALWESYATSRASARGNREPVPLAELVRVLGDDLRIRGDERRRQPIPRVVLGVALWNLALRNLDPSTIPPGDRAAVTQLDTLVKEVFGWSLLEIRVMRRQNIDPLLMVARQYAIFDYRWEPPQPDATPIGAKLEILLQRPLEQFKEALDPANWSKKCDLLWANVRATQPRSIARQRPTRAFLAELNLPGPGRDGSPEVIVESDLFEIPLGLRNAFRVSVDRGNQDPLVICEGSISAEKEPGQPWATRIKHEKRITAEPRSLDGHEVNTLTYWMQAETVCFVLPH